MLSSSSAININKNRILGGLITTIIEVSQQTTGMRVNNIDFTNISLYMITDDESKLICAVFMDRDDGVLFGKLITNEILNSFIQEYSSDVTKFVGKSL